MTDGKARTYIDSLPIIDPRPIRSIHRNVRTRASVRHQG